MVRFSFSGFDKMNQDSPSTARKTGGQPSKLVDLGAAATFAQQSSSSTQQPSGLFFGDTPQPQTTTTNSGGAAGGFANFEAAFQGPSEETQSAGELCC